MNWMMLTHTGILKAMREADAALHISPIQMPIVQKPSSQTAHLPEVMFNHPSGHSLCQSTWHIKLAFFPHLYPTQGVKQVPGPPMFLLGDCRAPFSEFLKEMADLMHHFPMTWSSPNLNKCCFAREKDFFFLVCFVFSLQCVELLAEWKHKVEEERQMEKWKKNWKGRWERNPGVLIRHSSHGYYPNSLLNILIPGLLLKIKLMSSLTGRHCDITPAQGSLEQQPRLSRWFPRTPESVKRSLCGAWIV